MRRKRRGVTPRFSTSPPPPPPSSSSPHQHQHDYSSSSTSTEDALDRVDAAVRESCLICREAGHLLVCSNIDCPISLHRVCMQRSPSFDDAGNFYCPYCWYKQQLLKTTQLRKKAMLASKALSDFILLNTDQLKELPQNQHHHNIPGLTKPAKDSLPTKQTSPQHISATPEFESAEDEEGGEEARQGMDGGQVDGDQIEPMLEHEEPLPEPSGACCVEEEIDIEDGVRGAADANCVQGRRKKKNKMLQDPMDTTTGDALPKVPQLSDSDNEAIMVRLRRVKHRANRKPTQHQTADSLKKTPTQPHTNSEKNSRKQKKVVSSHKTLKQPRESAKNATSPRYANEKRKRLHWTAEEEDMLKEGVHKFSTSVNKNIPWRKILEFGRHVFDATRNPTDLKDKWRKILARD